MAEKALARQEATSNLSVVQPESSGVVERVVIMGDLSELSPNERVNYYLETCRSLGLNPFTKPLGYITLPGAGLTLYVKRDGADQLRAIHKVSVEILGRENIDGLHIVTAKATTPDGRTDTATGAVPLVKEGGEWKSSSNGKRFFEKDGSVIPLPLEERANALMKAETKAKRRVTLSICGLGWLDESEVDSIKGARRVTVDHSTGEIIDTAGSTVDDRITREQIDRIKALMDEAGTTPEYVKTLHGKPSASHLTIEEANTLIDRLEEMVEAQQPPGETEAGVPTGGGPATESDTEYMARVLDAELAPAGDAGVDRYTA